MGIEIVYEPKVKLIGSNAIDDGELEEWFEEEEIDTEKIDYDNTDGDLIPEIAGRICYMSFENPRPGGNKAYLDNIHEMKHGSVLEHVSFNFIITHVSRSLTHELVRHRVGTAYSQLSQRYVQHNGIYVMPYEIAQGYKGVKDTWINAMEFAQSNYETLVVALDNEILASDIVNPISPTERRKSARQAARSVLPSAAETKLMFSVNARELLHIFGLRGSRHADKEIRMLAVKLFECVTNVAPNLFQMVSIDSSITPTGLIVS